MVEKVSEAALEGGAVVGEVGERGGPSVGASLTKGGRRKKGLKGNIQGVVHKELGQTGEWKETFRAWVEKGGWCRVVLRVLEDEKAGYVGVDLREYRLINNPKRPVDEGPGVVLPAGWAAEKANQAWLPTRKGIRFALDLVPGVYQLVGAVLKSRGM